MSILTRAGVKINSSSLEEALKQGGIDWIAVKGQLRHPETNELGNSYAVYRSDNRHVLKWGLSSIYQPIQQKDAFKPVQTMIDTLGCKIESAGTFRQGRRVWLDVSTPHNVEVVPGDLINLKLATENSHDGTSTQRCIIVPERVLGETCMVLPHPGMMKGFKIRHTANAQEQLQDVLEIYNRSVTYMDQMNKMLQKFVKQEIKLLEAIEVLHRVYPDGDDPESAELTRTTVLNSFRENNGDGIEQIKNTAYSLLISIYKYEDHQTRSPRQRPENHARKIVMGSGLKFKFLALEEIENTTK